MKRHLRLCLVALISLALPLGGMAGIQVQVEPCPMKTAAMAKMAPEASVDAGPDCCQDMGAPSDHGKPCKPGQECKTASLLQVLTMKPPATLASTIMVSFSSDTPLTQAPSGVWRPPRV